MESPKDIAHSLPEESGCYLMKNNEGIVIYVGKAKNLRRRVSQYFLPGKNAKTMALVEKINTIDYVITGNEYEALVLENNLIKKYNPHYNILLKDGKSYPVLRITNEKFPRIYKTRRIIKDGSKYYGPFPDITRLDLYLDMIESDYPLRRCDGYLKKRKSPCLYFHMEKCSGPCVGKIDENEYGEYVRKVEEVLDGDDTSLLKRLEKEMSEASKNLDFEKAAKKRDQIEALNIIQKNQGMEDYSSESGRDYIALEMRAYLCTVSIMQFRSGRMIGKALYRAECLGDETETLFSFLIQYYSDGETLPDEIFLSHEIDVELIKKYFSENFSKKINVSVPLDGKHFRILNMSKENAKRDVEKRLLSIDNTSSLEELQKVLELETLPRHIEGFDIAELSGKYTVSSLIVFRDGNPSNKEYRHFSMKSLQEGDINDFQSIKEAVFRRYKRLSNEKLELPDLIMVDGGKGQVSSATEALWELGLSIPIVGLAKKEETIVFQDGREIKLEHSNSALRVLIAVRDECHRFATSFNQRMRSKEASFTLLESITGVGKKRAESIMKKYDSLDEILSLSAEELSKGASIPLSVAERVIKKLNF